MDIGFILSNTAALSELLYSSPFGIVLLFLFTVFANASLFFPILVEPIVFAVSAFAPNLIVALLIGVVTGTAAAIGEMAGYIFGMFGVKTLQRFDEKRVEKIFEMGEKLANKGIPIIFLGSFTPFPFDIIGIAAGLIRYDPKKFFFAALLGKVLRYTIIAVAGFFGAVWIKAWVGM